MSGSRMAATLPRIRATIGHIPQKLKTGGIEPSARARLEILRRMITRLVREERCEFPWNRAIEARPYIERLIQLGVERGEQDEYTLEMMDWWLMEPDLRHKMFEVLVPRFRDAEGPFTSIFKLPTTRLEQFIQNKRVFWKRYEIAVLEIDGNPFPSVLGNQETEDKSSLLLNQLLRDSLRNRLKHLNTIEKSK